MARIEILAVIDKKGADYANFLITVGKMLSSGKNDIRWNSVVDVESRGAPGFRELGKVSCTQSPATNHAQSLHVGMDVLKDSGSDYVLFCDTDMSFLLKDWDIELLSLAQQYDVVGINRCSRKGYDPSRYARFPLVTFMMFKTSLINELTWKLHPQKKKLTGPHNSYKAGERDSKICGVPVGSKMKKDTGWDMPYSFYDKGYNNPFLLSENLVNHGSVMPYECRKDRKFCQEFCKRKSKLHHMAEYGDPPLCTHLGGSRHFGFNSEIASLWRRRIKCHIKNLYNLEVLL